MVGFEPANAAGVDVADLRRMSGLSQEEFARVSGYSTRAVAGWEAGGSLAEPARRRVIELRRLFRALAELMPTGRVGSWLRTRNAAFGDLAPAHVIERGEADRIWEMIHQIDANVAN
jgi:transcriptional regulator with XRE-family HTH domain